MSVRIRAVGEGAWRQAMPLLRVPAGKSLGTRPIYSWDNKHSASIFDLAPDTEYEIELTLHDPDGGSQQRTPLAVRIGPRLFSDVADLRRETGQKHAVRVEWNPFVKAEFPASAFPAHPVPDFRLGPLSAASAPRGRRPRPGAAREPKNGM